MHNAILQDGGWQAHVALIERLLKMAHVYPSVNAKHRTLLCTALNNVRNALRPCIALHACAFRLHCSECIRADMIGRLRSPCSVRRIGAVLSPKKYCAGPCDAVVGRRMQRCTSTCKRIWRSSQLLRATSTRSAGAVQSH